MRTLQIESTTDENRTILKAVGVRRIHPGWYAVQYRGPVLDSSTVCAAKRNLKGEIKG